jgi:hypothetical protein
MASQADPDHPGPLATWMAPFAGCFTRPTRANLLVLVAGVILFPGAAHRCRGAEQRGPARGGHLHQLPSRAEPQSLVGPGCCALPAWPAGRSLRAGRTGRGWHQQNHRAPLGSKDQGARHLPRPRALQLRPLRQGIRPALDQPGPWQGFVRDPHTSVPEGTTGLNRGVWASRKAAAPDGHALAVQAGSLLVARPPAAERRLAGPLGRVRRARRRRGCWVGGGGCGILLGDGLRRPAPPCGSRRRAGQQARGRRRSGCAADASSRSPGKGVRGASERKTYVRPCRTTCRGALPFCDIHLQQKSTRPAWGLAAVA